MLRGMAVAPRTFAADEPFDDVEAPLEHLSLHLNASALTQALAPTIDQLLVGLDGCRSNRRALARALFALKAKEIFVDDDLNKILDDVKATLAADKSPAGVDLYKDVFDNKPPTETRKYVLGPQLTAMSLWPGKLAGSSRPEVQALGAVTKKATADATDLLNEIGKAETALDQFDAGPRADFIASCNAAVKVVYGKLSELEHTPPSGPLPAGFVDRFILRDTSSRLPTIKELEASIARTTAKLDRQNALLAELKGKQAKDLKDKQDAELAALKAKAAAAQKVIDDANAELAQLQAEMAKNTTPPGGE